MYPLCGDIVAIVISLLPGLGVGGGGGGGGGWGGGEGEGRGGNGGNMDANKYEALAVFSVNDKPKLQRYRENTVAFA